MNHNDYENILHNGCILQSCMKPINVKDICFFCQCTHTCTFCAPVQCLTKQKSSNTLHLASRRNHADQTDKTAGVIATATRAVTTRPSGLQWGWQQCSLTTQTCDTCDQFVHILFYFIRGLSSAHTRATVCTSVLIAHWGQVCTGLQPCCGCTLTRTIISFCAHWTCLD